MHGRSACVCRETMEEEWMECGLGEQEVPGRNWEGEREENLDRVVKTTKLTTTKTNQKNKP